MRDAILVAASLVMGLGLALILWRELAGAADRRRVGALRDSVEVLLPVLATVALVAWAWIA